MVCVFFHQSLFQKAIGKVAVSKVTLVLSTQTVLGIPFTLALDVLKPGIFGEIPSSWTTWTLRCVGCVLIMFGIAKLIPKKQR